MRAGKKNDGPRTRKKITNWRYLTKWKHNEKQSENITKINLQICLKLQVYNEYINASYDVKVRISEVNKVAWKQN